MKSRGGPPGAPSIGPKEPIGTIEPLTSSTSAGVTLFALGCVS